MIKAEQRYNGTVAAGSGLTESNNGTLGFQVNLECEDGDTQFTIWLTEKNQENARKAFVDALGVRESDLKDPNYIEYQLGSDIEGREVSFGTKAEEYKGKTQIKVIWIGKKRDQLEGGLASAAARFFGGKPKNQESTPDADEIPF